MSGLPGGEPGATRPNWVVNAWNSAALDVLDYQWEIAAAFWTEIDQLAKDHGVKVALEPVSYTHLTLPTIHSV